MEADPIQHSGLDFVNEIIKGNLQVNRSYSLKVKTNIYSQNDIVQTSDQQFFSRLKMQKKILWFVDYLLSNHKGTRKFYSKRQTCCD